MFRSKVPMTSKFDHDLVRPRMDPHRAIFDAFQEEASKRNGRSVEDWTKAELDAVYQAALRVSQDAVYKLKPPTMGAVIAAELYARGSVDYGHTWVWKLLQSMSYRT